MDINNKWTSKNDFYHRTPNNQNDPALAEKQAVDRFLGARKNDNINKGDVELAWKYFVAHPQYFMTYPLYKNIYGEVGHSLKAAKAAAERLYQLKENSDEKLSEFNAAMSTIIRETDKDSYSPRKFAECLYTVLRKEIDYGHPQASTLFTEYYQHFEEVFPGLELARMKEEADALDADPKSGYSYAVHIPMVYPTEQDPDFYKYMMQSADKGYIPAQVEVLNFRKNCPQSVQVPDDLLQKCVCALVGSNYGHIDKSRFIEHVLDVKSSAVKGKVAFELAYLTNFTKVKERYLQIAIENDYEPAKWVEQGDVAGLINLCELFDAGAAKICY